jgi:hypothetical protein
MNTTVNYLRHGDLVTLSNMSGQGYLASKGDEDRTNKAGSDLCVLPMLDGGKTFPSDFQNRCVFQVDFEEVGDEAAGSQVVYGANGNGMRLIHMQTQRWVTAMGNTSADPSMFLAQLSKQEKANKQQAKFFAMPRYKMRSEGELVYFEDILVLQSRRFKGQNLVYTKKSEADPGESGAGVFMNAAAKYGWRIKAFSAYDNALKMALKGGDMVRLFHREMEGLLQCNLDDLSIRERENRGGEAVNEIVERLQVEDKSAVHTVSLKLSNMLKNSKVTHNSGSIWQVQHETPQDGTPVKWSEVCRLKHVVTGQFLCIKGPEDSKPSPSSKPGEELASLSFNAAASPFGPVWFPITDVDRTQRWYCVCTTNTYSDEGTLFTFEQVTLSAMAEEFVSFGNYSRIQHSKTKTYLNLHTGEERGGSDTGSYATVDKSVGSDGGNSANHSGSQTSTAKTGASSSAAKTAERTVTVRVQHGVPDEDVFSFYEVEAYDVEAIYFVRTRMIPIMEYIQTLQATTTLLTQDEADFENGEIDLEEINRVGENMMEANTLLKTALGSLLLFVLGDDEGARAFTGSDVELQEALSQNARPQKLRQKIIREQHGIEMMLKVCNDSMQLLDKNDGGVREKPARFTYLENLARVDKERVEKAQQQMKQQRMKDSHNGEKGRKHTEKAHEELVTTLGPGVLALLNIISPEGLDDSCSLVYALLRALLVNNVKSVRLVIESGGVESMILHLSTPWEPPVKEVFESYSHYKAKMAKGGPSSSGAKKMKGLKRKDIKQLVDQIHFRRSEYSYRLVEFLASVCAPAGSPDPQVQQWVLGQMLGNKPRQSSLVYHTKQKDKVVVANDVDGRGQKMVSKKTLYINTTPLMLGKRRPPYVPDEYEQEMNGDERFDYDWEQKVEPDMVGDNDITWQQLPEWISEGLEAENADPNATDTGNSIGKFAQVQYFLATLKLFAALCVGRNREAQSIVRQLFSADSILLFLERPPVTPGNSITLFTDLMKFVYVDSYELAPRPPSLLNKTVLWEDELEDNNQELRVGENKKVLSTVSQMKMNVGSREEDMKRLGKMTKKQLRHILRSHGYDEEDWEYARFDIKYDVDFEDEEGGEDDGNASKGEETDAEEDEESEEQDREVVFIAPFGKGSNETGDGSEKRPYDTLKFAFEQVALQREEAAEQMAQDEDVHEVSNHYTFVVRELPAFKRDWDKDGNEIHKVPLIMPVNADGSKLDLVALAAAAGNGAKMKHVEQIKAPVADLASVGAHVHARESENEDKAIKKGMLVRLRCAVPKPKLPDGSLVDDSTQSSGWFPAVDAKKAANGAGLDFDTTMANGKIRFAKVTSVHGTVRKRDLVERVHQLKKWKHYAITDRLRVTERQRLVNYCLQRLDPETGVHKKKLLCPDTQASETADANLVGAERDRAELAELQDAEGVLSTLELASWMMDQGMFDKDYNEVPKWSWFRKYDDILENEAGGDADKAGTLLPDPLRDTLAEYNAAMEEQETAREQYFGFGMVSDEASLRMLADLLVRLLADSDPTRFAASRFGEGTDSSDREEMKEFFDMMYLHIGPITAKDRFIVKAKIEALAIMQKIYDLNQSAVLGNLWEKFKELYIEHVEKQLWPNKKTRYADQRDFEVVRDDFSVVCNEELNVNNGLIDQIILSTENEAVFDENMFKNKLAVLTESLLNITLYNEPSIVAEGFRLLHRQYGGRKELLPYLENLSLVLDEQDQATVKLIDNHLAEFTKLTAGSFRKLKEGDLKKLHRIFRWSNGEEGDIGLTNLCFQELFDEDHWDHNIVTYFDDISEIWVDDLNVNDDDSGDDTPVAGAAAAAAAADTKADDGEDGEDGNKDDDELEEWHPYTDDAVGVNQEYIRTSAVHRQVLRFLKRVIGVSGKSRASLEDMGLSALHIQIIKDCLEFLYWFSMDNEENTEELSSPSVMRQLLAQINFGPEMVKLLTNIIEDNREANNQLSDGHMKMMVQKLVDEHTVHARDGDSETGYSVDYIELLKATVEDDYGPRYDRQQMVVQQLKNGLDDDIIASITFVDTETGDYDFAGKVCGAFSSMCNTQKLDDYNMLPDMEAPENSLEERALTFHLQFVDLVGMCAKGHNQVTETYARTLFELQEVMKPLTAKMPGTGKPVPIPLKSPFLRMLHGVFFSCDETTGAVMDKGAGGNPMSQGLRSNTAGDVPSLKAVGAAAMVGASLDGGGGGGGGAPSLKAVGAAAMVGASLDDAPATAGFSPIKGKRFSTGANSVDRMVSTGDVWVDNWGRFVQVFKAFKRDLKFLGQLFDKGVKATDVEKETREVYCDYVFDVLMPFLTDFFSDEWSLEPPEEWLQQAIASGMDLNAQGVPKNTNLVEVCQEIAKLTSRLGMRKEVLQSGNFRESTKELLDKLKLKQLANGKYLLAGDGGKHKLNKMTTALGAGAAAFATGGVGVTEASAHITHAAKKRVSNLGPRKKNEPFRWRDKDRADLDKCVQKLALFIDEDGEAEGVDTDYNDDEEVCKDNRMKSMIKNNSLPVFIEAFEQALLEKERIEVQILRDGNSALRPLVNVRNQSCLTAYLEDPQCDPMIARLVDIFTSKIRCYAELTDNDEEYVRETLQDQMTRQVSKTVAGRGRANSNIMGRTLSSFSTAGGETSASSENGSRRTVHSKFSSGWHSETSSKHWHSNFNLNRKTTEEHEAHFNASAIKQSYRADADGTAWQKVKTSVRFGGAPGNKEVVNPLTANAGIPAEAEEPKLREKKKDKHTLKDLGKDVEMTATGVSRTLENL